MKHFILLVSICVVVCASVAKNANSVDESEIQLDIAWTEYNTSSFTLFTDEDESKAQEILFELEVLSTSLKKLLQVNTGLTLPKLTVYQFNDDDLFKTVSGIDKFSGYYKDTINGPTVVLKPSTSGRSDQYSILFHEYVHYFQRAVTGPKQAVWYREGLADFFSSFRVGQESVYLGTFPKGRVNALRHLGIYPLAKLFSATQYPQNERQIAKFYATSWLVTNFFTIGSRNGYQDYSVALNKMLALQSQGVNGEKAFTQSFDINLDELTTQLRGFGRRENIVGLKMPLPAVEYNVDKRPLTLGESYAVLAQISISEARHDVFEAFLRQGAKLNDPRSLANLASWREYKDDTQEAEQLLARLTNVAEDDYQSFMFMGDVYFNRMRKLKNPQDADLAIEYYEKSIAIKPQAYSLERLLTVSAMSGKHKKAAQYANDLYQMNPLSFRVNWVVGRYFAENGNPAFAKFLLKNVIAWSAHNDLENGAQTLLEKLDTK